MCVDKHHVFGAAVSDIYYNSFRGFHKRLNEPAGSRNHDAMNEALTWGLVRMLSRQKGHCDAEKRNTSHMCSCVNPSTEYSEHLGLLRFSKNNNSRTCNYFKVSLPPN